MGKKTVAAFVAVIAADLVGVLPGQTSADLHALGKGVTNTAIAVPVLARCVLDYRNSLKGKEYPSDEYIVARTECHERSALRVLWAA
jgi:stage V sporulation protein SpoVS